MHVICPITHHGQVAAIVAAGRAIIATELPDTERRAVQAKCLYALQVQAGELPGPYSPEQADLYARSAARRHHRST